MFRFLVEQQTAADEAALIRRAAAGEGEAFAELVRLHQASVRWRLARLVRDPATVDDLAQEVFVRAFRHLSAGRPIDGLRAWLLGVACNVARENLRSLIRRRQRETNFLAARLAQWRLERLANTGALADTSVDDQEHVFASLNGCLAELPPESRQLVEQHYFKGQTLEEIARRRNRKSSAIRMALLRVRAALQKCLRKKIDDNP